jgi:hypothetical protein
VDLISPKWGTCRAFLDKDGLGISGSSKNRIGSIERESGNAFENSASGFGKDKLELTWAKIK